ncbi:hypothetical protein SH449x_002864 [Pirellulaceae bacterium SH449]
MFRNSRRKLAELLNPTIKKTSGKRLSVNAGKPSGKTRTGRKLVAEQLEARNLFAGLVFESVITTESDYPVGKSYAYTVAADSAGNTFMGGIFEGTVDFDRNAIQPGNQDILTVEPNGSGGFNGFIAKYDSQGQFVWVKRMDGSALGLEVDSSGNLYVGGEFSNSANFGPFTLNSLGGSDQFAAKLDQNGNYMWAINWGTADPETFSDMVLDDDGNLTIAGRSRPSGPSSTPGITQLRQLNSQGQVVWTGDFAAQRAIVNSLAVDASGDIYWAGTFRESVDLDPGSAVQLFTASAASSSSFVAKLSVNGEFQWATTFDSDTSIDPNSLVLAPVVAIGNDGFVTALGSYRGNVRVSSNSGLSLPYSNSDKGYLAKLNSANGGVATISAYGGSLGSIRGLIATSDGYAAVGSTGGTGGFNPTPNISLAGKGSNDVWIMALDGQGSITWAGLVGGTSIDSAHDLAQDATGKLLVTGFSASTLFDFDPHPSLSYDVSRPASFVLKVKPMLATKFYVVDDASNDRTFEYAADHSSVENYSLNSGNSAPRGAASTVAGDKVWVVDANKKVYVYNNSGTLLGSWTAGSVASNATIEGITTNGTDVWLVDARQDRVYRYTNAASRLSGSQNAASNFALNSGNLNPKDIVTDGTNIWVVNDSTTDKVFKYTMTGALVGSWTIDSANKAPTGLTIDPSGASQSIWIVDNGTDRVYEYTNARSRNSGSQSASLSFALAAGNTNPQGIADPPAPSSAAVTAVAATFEHTNPFIADEQGLSAQMLGGSRSLDLAASPLFELARRSGENRMETIRSHERGDRVVAVPTSLVPFLSSPIAAPAANVDAVDEAFAGLDSLFDDNEDESLWSPLEASITGSRMG